MFIPKSLFINRIFLLVCLNLFFFTSNAQVGIGTVDPDPSAMLDVSSTSQGILAPRMTTAQRVAISNPANGLLVYDLDERSFYFYEETVPEWVRLNSSQEQRDNFVLVKTLADFPAPSGAGVITLDTNTYYEINGIINLAGNKINLNNAYLSGLDANEDVIVAGAGTTAFQGSTGGSIRNITITGGGTAFNITGATGQSLLLQNTIVANMASVGTLAGLGVFFSNIVQYVGNTNGITYTGIDNLLLSNQAWFGNNGGTYETFTGTFQLIQKVSGFSTVPLGATGINVSSNPTVGEGILLSTLFTGAGTYVNRYTTGSYPGFNFNNNWVVNCPGIPRESDNEATGNIYYNGDLAGGFAQAIPTTVNTPFNLANNTTTLAPNNFRVTSPENNRLTYAGRRPKTFQVNATLAVRANTTNTQSTFFAFFIRKNGNTGTTLVPTNTVMRTPNSSGSGAELVSLSISGTVDLVPGDYIKVWGQRLTGGNLTSPQLAIFAVNMNIK
tara:strand:- start:65647 stop:67143 length:1497 start_codon:yes stop_codon:yes gene_type:complete